MRAIVCGSRRLMDREAVYAKLDELRATMGLSFVIESGWYRRHGKTRRAIGGAAFFAKEWALERGVPWRTVKNDFMGLFRGGPHLVVAFEPDDHTEEILALAWSEHVPEMRVR